MSSNSGSCLYTGHLSFRASWDLRGKSLKCSFSVKSGMVLPQVLLAGVFEDLRDSGGADDAGEFCLECLDIPESEMSLQIL